MSRQAPPASPRFAYKGDRLKPLRAFCQTARLGSVSRAAEALYLSQPAVTLQLQALERELGVRLLERSGRRITLTREGQELYELARPLVEGLDGARRAPSASGSAASMPASCNVAAGSSTILYLLPPIVRGLPRRAPGGAPDPAQRHRRRRPGPAALGRGRPGGGLDARRARPTSATSRSTASSRC